MIKNLLKTKEHIELPKILDKVLYDEVVKAVQDAGIDITRVPTFEALKTITPYKANSTRVMSISFYTGTAYTRYLDATVSSFYLENNVLSFAEVIVHIRAIKACYDNIAMANKIMDKANTTSGKTLVLQKEGTVELPSYYNNEKGSLYKIANDRGWNTYLFDIVKRLERGGKKDPLEKEITKSIGVLELWMKEQVK